jgi:hypothetical protein
MLHRREHLGGFGQLSGATEFWMFGLPIFAGTAGLFEMMMRARGNIPRPAALRFRPEVRDLPASPQAAVTR